MCTPCEDPKEFSTPSSVTVQCDLSVFFLSTILSGFSVITIALITGLIERKRERDQQLLFHEEPFTTVVEFGVIN